MPPARIVVIDGPDVGLEHIVGAGGCRIGRSEDCELQLTDLAVSRSHCAIEVRGSQHVLVVAGARNKTQIDGAQVDEERELRDGDELQIGRSRLVFLCEDAGLHVVIAGASAHATTELGADDMTSLAADQPTRHLAALARLGDRMRDAARREDAAQVACEILHELLGASRVALLSRDGSSRLTAIAHVGYTARERIVSLREPLVERVLRERRVVLADTDGSIVLVAPIAGAGGDAMGLVYVERSGEIMANAWGEAELHVVATAAHLVAGFLRQLDSRSALVREVAALEQRMGGSTEIVGDGPRTTEIRALIERVAVTGSTVLLLGESGVGKELVASAIHRKSRRASGPFVCVNCAALSETLLESELFGHERGAFTGATERRVGRFELAEGGTLFLDEVAELTLHCQTRFLRVLEERRFERVGSTRSIAADVRVIAATNRDLSAMVEAGEFREDLYFRLAVLQIVIPPLRERADDIPALCEHLLDRIRAQTGRRPTQIAPDAATALRAYAWPGNVRELRNALEQAVVLGDGVTIQLADLPPQIQSGPPRSAPERRARSLKQWEEDAIRAALAETGGNKLRAAALLGIDRSTLYKRLRELGID